MNYGFSRGAQQYQQVSTSGAQYADPHQQVLMLMDGALARIAQAKGALERKAMAEKGERLSKAIALIGGLRAGLDMANGGEVAANLAALYDYMERQLLQANLKHDAVRMDEVAVLMREIRDAWAAIPSEARVPNGTAG